jgi:hypothetical protein
MKIDELKSYREPTGGVVVNNSPYSTKYVIDFLLSELAAEVKRREEAERYALQIADDLNTALSEDDDDLKAAESALAEAERRGMAKDAALAKIADAQNWFHTTDENGGPYTAWRGDGEPDQLAENAIRSAIAK